MRVAAAMHAAAAAAARAKVEVWSYDPSTNQDVLAQQTGSATSSDPIARTAYDNAVRVMDYYARTYGRNSFDGRGTTLKLRVHSPDMDGTLPANNAYWVQDEKRIWLGDGDGSFLGPTGNAADILAHEFTHGVMYEMFRVDAAEKITPFFQRSSTLPFMLAGTAAAAIGAIMYLSDQD